MKIEILSHRELVQRVFQRPPPNVIFVSNPENPYIVERSEEAVGRVAHKLVLLFEDVDSVQSEYAAPRKQHIQEAIRFSENLDELVVSCRMGVSRSAGIAFAIAAHRFGMAKGFDVLQPERHFPNALIVKHTQELLDLPYLTEAMTCWKREQTKEFKYYLDEHREAIRRREKLRPK